MAIEESVTFDCSMVDHNIAEYIYGGHLPLYKLGGGPTMVPVKPPKELCSRRRHLVESVYGDHLYVQLDKKTYMRLDMLLSRDIFQDGLHTVLVADGSTYREDMCFTTRDLLRLCPEFKLVLKTDPVVEYLTRVGYK